MHKDPLFAKKCCQLLFNSIPSLNNQNTSVAAIGESNAVPDNFIDLQTRDMPYFAFYEAYSEELLKEMLHIRGIIDHPDIYKPLARKPMSEIEWREFDRILDRIGFRKQWPEL